MLVILPDVSLTVWCCWVTPDWKDQLILNPCGLLRLDTCDRYACAISDPDNNEVIITGGDNNRKKVSVYNELRWQRDLAPLNQERSYHGCASYRNGGKKVNQIVLDHTYLKYTFNCQFLMVTGGHREIDSTEIFSDNVWRTVAARLPAPMSEFRVATINNRLLAFGNWLLFVMDYLVYDAFLQVGFVGLGTRIIWRKL